MELLPPLEAGIRVVELRLPPAPTVTVIADAPGRDCDVNALTPPPPPPPPVGPPPLALEPPPPPPPTRRKLSPVIDATYAALPASILL
jgi:hypothetical protein